MFGFVGEAAGDLDGLGDGGIRAQVVLSRLADFSSDNEVRPLEFFQGDGRLGIVEISGVGFADGVAELLHVQVLRPEQAGILQHHEAVGLHGEGLIEFRSDGEGHFQHVAGM